MSFNFRKAGKDAAALKASVQQESAPKQVKDELCRRIDMLASMIGAGGHYSGCCIVVHAVGHIETTSDGSLVLLNNAALEKFEVVAVPFLDTPVQA